MEAKFLLEWRAAPPANSATISMINLFKIVLKSKNERSISRNSRQMIGLKGIPSQRSIVN